MDFLTITIGGLCILLAVLGLIKSNRIDNAGGKLKAMIAYWGAVKGVWIYRIAYVVMPLLFGLGSIALGLNGVNILDILLGS